MMLSELIEAMRPGSRNPLAERAGHDLGRFGLGLKSASFSQCKKLTVASRKDGVFAAATWDLDEVAITNRWEVAIHSEPSSIPWGERLSENGTLVVWRSLDRLSGGLDNQPRKRAEYLNRTIASAERHIRLVFHRFMAEGQPGLAILLNGRELNPLIHSEPGSHPTRVIGPTGWNWVTELWSSSASRFLITNPFPSSIGKTLGARGAS
jgi:hypothetical protein